MVLIFLCASLRLRRKAGSSKVAADAEFKTALIRKKIPPMHSF